jgi:hypothetical protein
MFNDRLLSSMTSQSILLWRDPAEGDLCGANGLLRWRSFTRRVGDKFFVQYGEPAQLGAMARIALGEGLRRNQNIYVGWQPEDPATTSAVDVESAVARLWPITTYCPERSIDGDWCMSVFGETARLSRGAVEKAISDFRKQHMPMWAPGVEYRPHAAIIRVDTTAEELGLIPRHVPTPDDIYNSVSTDLAVLEASRRWDRRTPETHRDLVAAVLAAQERAGVPTADRAPLISGEIEEFLTPILMRMGAGEEREVVDLIRRDTRRRFGEYGQLVMEFMLRTYRHRDLAALLAFATEKVAA